MGFVSSHNIGLDLPSFDWSIPALLKESLLLSYIIVVVLHHLNE